MNKVLFGIDQFCISTDYNKNMRIGLATNDAARNTAGVKTRVALLHAGFQIVKLFSPEHGLSVHAADGAWVADQTDELTNLPVVSLYADKLRPTADDLQDVDAVVFDIPDVGCRFYTYLWTMTQLMEACVEHDKKFILLDSPNPLSGDIKKVEGPMLEPSCASFLGRWNIPIRHSCTLGELANYFASIKVPGLDMEIIKIQNWDRNDFPGKGTWDFVPTSPAIKDAEAALLYPGLGLQEGINVNEGRGTDSDFKILGAPWIKATSLKDHFDELELPGVAFSTTRYTPKWGMYEGEVCFGLTFHSIDQQLIRPVSLGIELLKQLIRHHPVDCRERLYKTNVHSRGDGHLDKLLGVTNAFNSLKNNIPVETELTNDQWQNIIVLYLLY